MELKKYLEKEGLTQRKFAIKAGLSPMNISQYVSGKRKPGAEALYKIKVATSGLVDAGDFITIDTESA